MVGKPTSPELIEEVKRFICQSSNATAFGKRAVLFLIDQTEGLTKDVTLAFTPRKGLAGQGIWDKNKLGQQAAHGVHDMNSSLGQTFLCEFLEKKGIIGRFEGGSTNISEIGHAYYVVFHSTGYLINKEDYFGLKMVASRRQIKKVKLLS
jgi:hypothetical protein